MSRKICNQCIRPERACICAFITPVNNNIDVIVLQHPSEVSQTKGTVALLSRSLRSCQVIVAQDFSQNIAFKEVLTKYQPLLLYPSEHAKVLSVKSAEQQNENVFNCEELAKVNEKPYCLIILDGTWKKAYRMYMLCEKLQQLPQVCLPEYLAQAGQYKIRKVAKLNALSSLEACCYALSLLEGTSSGMNKGKAISNSDCIDAKGADNNQVDKYKGLIQKFLAFNEFQLSFRPKSHKVK